MAAAAAAGLLKQSCTLQGTQPPQWVSLLVHSSVAMRDLFLRLGYLTFDKCQTCFLGSVLVMSGPKFTLIDSCTPVDVTWISKEIQVCYKSKSGLLVF